MSNKMMRTVVVEVNRLRQDPKYKKFYRASRKYKADTEDAKSYAVGDVVKIKETRPVSKDKRWKVVGVVRKAPQEEPLEDDAASGAEQS